MLINKISSLSNQTIKSYIKEKFNINLNKYKPEPKYPGGSISTPIFEPVEILLNDTSSYFIDYILSGNISNPNDNIIESGSIGLSFVFVNYTDLNQYMYFKGTLDRKAGGTDTGSITFNCNHEIEFTSDEYTLVGSSNDYPIATSLTIFEGSL